MKFLFKFLPILCFVTTFLYLPQLFFYPHHPFSTLPSAPFHSLLSSFTSFHSFPITVSFLYLLPSIAFTATASFTLTATFYCFIFFLSATTSFLFPPALPQPPHYYLLPATILPLPSSYSFSFPFHRQRFTLISFSFLFPPSTANFPLLYPPLPSLPPPCHFLFYFLLFLFLPPPTFHFFTFISCLHHHLAMSFLPHHHKHNHPTSSLSFQWSHSTFSLLFYVHRQPPTLLPPPS